MLLGGCDKPPEKWKRNKVYTKTGELTEVPPRKTVAAAVINPVAKIIGDSLQIQNQDSFDWPSMKIFLNGIVAGYRLECKGLAAGKSAIIPLNEFAKRDGTRFQIQLTKPKELVISVPGYDSPVLTW